jgi:hypothetical protein
MENNNTEKQKPDHTVVKKPDVKAGLLIQCLVKISDPKTGQVLLKTRG